MANNTKRNSNKRKGKGKGGKKSAPKAPVPSAATIVADALPMKVVSSDGVEFEISVKAAKRCLNIMKYVKEVNAEEYPSTAPPMHFPDVHSDYMKDVVEWCEYHRDYPLFEEKDKYRKRTVPVPRATWEHEFVSQFGPNEINGLICAAHAFDARCLLDRSAQALASMIKGKTSEQLRQTFGIKNDFTPEEEARMLEENKEMEKLEKRLHTRKAISFFKKLKEASGGGCDCDCNRNNRKDRSDSDSEEEDHDEAGPGPSTSKNRIEQRRQQICEHLCNGHH